LLRVREATAGLGRHSRVFTDLTAVTAWRDGVAYLADLTLDRHVTVDNATLSLVGQTTLTIELRAFGGYAFADVAWDGAGVKAALNALNLSLAGAAAFAGLEGEMEGMVDLAKLTFNGDPGRPLSGQISLRLEAKEFAWRKNAVEELAIGLSVAGGGCASMNATCGRRRIPFVCAVRSPSPRPHRDGARCLLTTTLTPISATFVP
jgi:hypothetical protein